MNSLPIVIPCAGNCGAWLSPATEPSARTESSPGMGYRPLRFCPACQARITMPVVITKEVAPDTKPVAVEAKVIPRRGRLPGRR